MAKFYSSNFVVFGQDLDPLERAVIFVLELVLDVVVAGHGAKERVTVIPVHQRDEEDGANQPRGGN